MRTLLFSLLFVVVVSTLQAQSKTSGSPLFKGWYANPEAIFGKQYRTYPTYYEKGNILPVKITHKGVPGLRL